MPSKRVILAIIAVALAFGVVVSGCNRDNGTRVAQTGKKRQTQTAKKSRKGAKTRPDSRIDRRRDSRSGTDDVELAQAPATRPAEVLAATARRPQQRRGPAARPQPMYQQNYQPLPVAIAVSHDLARVQEPLPEPVPVSQLYTQIQTRPAPYYYSNTHVAPEQPQVVHPSPELAMARAALEPAPFAAPASAPQTRPVGFVPPIEPQMFRAPIPELEPVRYQRVAAAEQPRPVPVLMSGPVPAWSASSQTTAREEQSAVYDSQPSQTRIQGWVPSPATAMGGVRGTY